MREASGWDSLLPTSVHELIGQGDEASVFHLDVRDEHGLRECGPGAEPTAGPIVLRKNTTAAARSREQDRGEPRSCSYAKTQTWSEQFGRVGPRARVHGEVLRQKAEH